MKLSDILALWAAKQLPEGYEQLSNCANVMEGAFWTTQAAWLSCTNPVTAAMLEQEMDTYHRIIWAIYRRLEVRNMPKAHTIRKPNKSMFYLASSAI